MKFLNKTRKSKLWKKLHKNQGFTLVEMLAATAILALLAMMLHSGLFMAQNSYNKMTTEAETQLLLSTASNKIADELRYARDVEAEGGILQRYTSINYGVNTTISINDKGYLVSSGKAMLPSGAYGNGEYKIDQLKIMYDESGIFHVYMKVAGRFGISTETEFYVNCLNESGNEEGDHK